MARQSKGLAVPLLPELIVSSRLSSLSPPVHSHPPTTEEQGEDEDERSGVRPMEIELLAIKVQDKAPTLSICLLLCRRLPLFVRNDESVQLLGHPLPLHLPLPSVRRAAPLPHGG